MCVATSSNASDPSSFASMLPSQLASVYHHNQARFVDVAKSLLWKLSFVLSVKIFSFYDSNKYKAKAQGNLFLHNNTTQVATRDTLA